MSRNYSASHFSQNQTIAEEEAHNFRLPEPPSAGSNALMTVFHVRESQLDIEKRIHASRAAIMSRKDAKTASASMYQRVLPIPLRPVWSNRMSKEEVQRNEQERFDKYLETIYNALPPSRLNHFEHNLGVWRQLWRTCELSDILLFCVDARHPLFHFPPSLYEFIVKKMKKPMIVIFNKVDLVPADVVQCWKAYFANRFPQVSIVEFSSFPNNEADSAVPKDEDVRHRQARGLTNSSRVTKVKPVGVAELLQRVRSLIPKQDVEPSAPPADALVVAESTEAAGAAANSGLLEPEASSLAEMSGDEQALASKPESRPGPVTPTELPTGADNLPSRKLRTQKRMFTMGMVGHPNAGKSSVINSMLGHVAVSVSATPGHTKYIQTMPIHVEGMNDWQVCDCPGLVFPAADMPRPLQVLMSIVPLASLREPYSSVGFLAQRLDLIKIYRLSPYLGSDGDAAIAGVLAPVTILREIQAKDKKGPDLSEDNLDLDYVLSSPMSNAQAKAASETSSGEGSARMVAMKQRKKKSGSSSSPKRKNDVEAVDLFDALNAEFVMSAGAGSERKNGERSANLESRFVWSAWRICEALGAKMGWREQGGRPDTYRAAVQIIKDCLEGRVAFYFKPPALEPAS